MGLGIHVEHIGPPLRLTGAVLTARTAEGLGYDSVWTAESVGADATSVAAFIAAQTTTIKLGGALLQIPARTAAATAMTAASIDQLPGGG